MSEEQTKRQLSDQESIEVLNALIPPLKTKQPQQVRFPNMPQLSSTMGQCSLDENNEKAPTEVTVTPASPGAENEPRSSGGCPFFMGDNRKLKKQLSRSEHKGKKNPEWQTSVSVATEPVFYHDYLQLDKVLNAQFPVSAKYGTLAHDEHLFILIHQTYELWFKQIIFELDSIVDLLAKPVVDDRCILVVVSRIQRINMIWKNNRIKYNQLPYDHVFTEQEFKDKLNEAREAPSLLKLIDAWLARTPGLVTHDTDTETGKEVEYNYMCKEYEKSVNQYLIDTYVKPAEDEEDEEEKKSLMDEYKKNMDSFSTIFSEEKHNKLMERGERKLSHHALWGALFIWLNRDEPRFHLPYQLLSLLTELDALINRWRYSHALLAQRQVGNKAGTGGSSGYSYLRSTASDRYKIFNDIVNLSTWLIPREYVPVITDDIKKRLNTFD